MSHRMTTMAPRSVEQLDTERVGAIVASGWGARVRIFQPRNLAFWVWALLVGWGMLIWVHDVSRQATYYAPAISLGVVVFTVYGAVFWWFTQHIDRYSAQPARLRVAAFLWGGFAATWVAGGPANNAARALYAKLFGQDFAADWGAALIVPVSEEWSKAFGLLLLIAIAPRVVRTVFDGFVLGAFLGLGFQIVEDISYIQTGAATGFGADQIGVTMLTYAMRISTGVAGHILFTAIFCTGLVYLLGLPEQPRRVGRGLLLIGTAMVIHGVWDSEGAIARALLSDTTAAGVLTMVLMPLVPIAALIVCVLVFQSAVQVERAFMADMLAPEVARGVLTDEEVAAAAGDRKARRRYRRTGAGLGHRRRNRQVLDAVFDLAHELGQAGGHSTDRVQFARGEVQRLRERAG